MNKLLPISLLLLSFSAFGQPSSKASRSNIELSMTKTGVLIKRHSRLVGTVKEIEFHKFEAEDVLNKTKLRGVQIGYSISGKKEVVFMDLDESKTLAKSLEFIRDNRFSPESQSKDDIDYKFVCRSGLEVTFAWVKKEWGIILDLGDGIAHKEVMIFELADVVKLITLLGEVNTTAF